MLRKYNTSQIAMMFLLILMGLMCASPVFADENALTGVNVGIFDVSVNDTSIKMLAAVFGDLIPNELDNIVIKGNPIIGAIKAFNVAMLAVGGVLAAYTVLAGTLGTAHDGEMLGKKFSSLWIPIRYSMGTALVLPVVGGGYCVMQALVMWLIIQGVGMADLVWHSYASNDVFKKSATSFKSILPDDYNRDIALAMFNSAYCVRVVNDTLAGNSEASEELRNFFDVSDINASTFGRGILEEEYLGVDVLRGNPLEGGKAPKKTVDINTGKEKEVVKERVAITYAAKQAISDRNKAYADYASRLKAGTMGRGAQHIELMGGDMIYGPAYRPISDFKLCGGVTIPSIHDDEGLYKSEAKGPSSETGNTGRLGNIGAIFVKPKLVDANQFFGDALVELSEKVDAIADKTFQLVKPQFDSGKDITLNESEVDALLSVAAAEYTKKIRENYTKKANLLGEGIIKSAGEQGWFLAGAWFTNIIMTNAAIQNVSKNKPEIWHPRIAMNSNFPDEFKEVIKKYYSPFSSLIATATVVEEKKDKIDACMEATDKHGADSSEAKSKCEGISQEEIAKKSGFGIESKDDTKNAVEKTMAKLAKFISKIDITEAKNDARHPLIILSDFGARLEQVGFWMYAGIAGVSIILAMLLGTGGIAVTNTLITILKLPLGAFLTGAIALKYFLPNLPFIMWVGALVGWLLLVIEAVLAAPLWAVMHMYPNGDDLTGRGGNGYKLVLMLLLRPVLMIFGLIAALIISDVFGEFINKTFYEVFFNATTVYTNSGFDFFRFISGTIIYAIVLYTFIKQTFALMFKLPEQMFRWIGGHGSSTMGEFAGEYAAANDRGAQMASAGIGMVAHQGLDKHVEKTKMQGLVRARTEDNINNKGMNAKEALAEAQEFYKGEGVGLLPGLKLNHDVAVARNKFEEAVAQNGGSWENIPLNKVESLMNSEDGRMLSNAVTAKVDGAQNNALKGISEAKTSANAAIDSLLAQGILTPEQAQTHRDAIDAMRDGTTKEINDFHSTLNRESRETTSSAVEKIGQMEGGFRQKVDDYLANHIPKANVTENPLSKPEGLSK